MTFCKKCIFKANFGDEVIEQNSQTKKETWNKDTKMGRLKKNNKNEEKKGQKLKWGEKTEGTKAENK